MCTHIGLGSSGFARRYSRNRCFFLFLRLLRCFSSPGSPPYTMDSCMDTWSLSMWVSPFRYLRITGYLLLPAAFRSLSRLSSALSAKASTLRSFLLNLIRYIALLWRACWVRLIPQSFCVYAWSSVRFFNFTSTFVFGFRYASSFNESQRPRMSFSLYFYKILWFSVFGFQGTMSNKDFWLFYQSLKTKIIILIFNHW